MASYPMHTFGHQPGPHLPCQPQGPPPQVGSGGNDFGSRILAKIRKDQRVSSATTERPVPPPMTVFTDSSVEEREKLDAIERDMRGVGSLQNKFSSVATHTVRRGNQRWSENFEECVAECREHFARLVAFHKRLRKKFIDPNFPPDSSTLTGPVSHLEDFKGKSELFKILRGQQQQQQQAQLMHNQPGKQQHPISWRRASTIAEEFQTEVRLSPTRGLPSHAEGSRLLDTNGFCAALNFLVATGAGAGGGRRTPELVVCYDCETGVLGSVSFREGSWLMELTDDCLPCDGSTGRPAFSKSVPDPCELWVPLLEKVSAKFAGSFEALHEVRASEALLELTGGSVRSLLPAPYVSSRHLQGLGGAQGGEGEKTSQADKRQRERVMEAVRSALGRGRCLLGVPARMESSEALTHSPSAPGPVMCLEGLLDMTAVICRPLGARGGGGATSGGDMRMRGDAGPASLTALPLASVPERFKQVVEFVEPSADTLRGTVVTHSDNCTPTLLVSLRRCPVVAAVSQMDARVRKGRAGPASVSLPPGPRGAPQVPPRATERMDSLGDFRYADGVGLSVYRLPRSALQAFHVFLYTKPDAHAPYGAALAPRFPEGFENSNSNGRGGGGGGGGSAFAGMDLEKLIASEFGKLELQTPPTFAEDLQTFTEFTADPEFAYLLFPQASGRVRRMVVEVHAEGCVAVRAAREQETSNFLRALPTASQLPPQVANPNHSFVLSHPARPFSHSSAPTRLPTETAPPPLMPPGTSTASFSVPSHPPQESPVPVLQHSDSGSLPGSYHAALFEQAAARSTPQEEGRSSNRRRPAPASFHATGSSPSPSAFRQAWERLQDMLMNPWAGSCCLGPGHMRPGQPPRYDAHEIRFAGRSYEEEEEVHNVRESAVGGLGGREPYGGL